MQRPVTAPTNELNNNIDFEVTKELLLRLNHKRNSNEKQQSRCEMQQSINLELTISTPNCSYELLLKN
jgi:hypothetical protein